MCPVPEQYRRRPDTEALTWYMLCVSSRQYQTQTYSFLDKYTAWIPEVQTTVYSGDDCYIEYEPLYPGYILVGIPDTVAPGDLEKEAKAYHPSFTLLRSVGGKYTAMSSEDLDNMLKSHSEYSVAAGSLGFKAGDKVRIKSGPLSGISGVVQTAKAGALKVTVQAFNKTLELSIHRDEFVYLEPYDQN